MRQEGMKTDWEKMRFRAQVAGSALDILKIKNLHR